MNELRDFVSGWVSTIRWNWRKATSGAIEGLPDGVGYAGPQAQWFTRCERCGRFRIYGQFVEQYGPSIIAGWWYECLVCCLDQMEQAFQRERSA